MSDMEILASIQRELSARQREAEPRRHEWTEDGVTFAVEEDPSTELPKLIGERFHGGTWTEVPLAREILRQEERIDAHQQVVALQGSELHKSEAEIGRLTDRVNALTVRIEETLDLLIGEVDGSRKVEQAYRLLEKVVMDGTKKGDPK